MFVTIRVTYFLPLVDVKIRQDAEYQREKMKNTSIFIIFPRWRFYPYSILNLLTWFLSSLLTFRTLLQIFDNGTAHNLAINLCRGDIPVPQQFLDGRNIGSFIY